ncbi:S8 family serine peptidase [Candidatus Eisenbacteria bacterium]|uniref:S8 family serine peptidase n=1 Tax=Eiseniibacteriota bacterium TaxID=2212470 RepID=A0ABV6YJ14_UNCEI
MANTHSRDRQIQASIRGGLLWGALLFSVALAGNTAAPGVIDTNAYWVFFTDRGPAANDAEILELARSIPPSAWARRSHDGLARLPDERDRPVWEPYVEEVVKHGHLRHRSRWLNAVSMDLSPAAKTTIGSLPFVKQIRPVAVAERASLGPKYDDRGRPLEQTLHPVSRSPVDWSSAPKLGSRLRSLDYGLAQYQLEEINVPPVHAMGYSGNRVRFMMLDTGFRKDHDVFAQTHILDEWDFVFEDGEVQNEFNDDPYQHGHGTGCWSTAGGYAPGNLIGPGYGASFVLAKTEDIRSETQAEEDNYVAALEWADSLGVALTSASLTYLCFDDGFCYNYDRKDGDTAVITQAVDIAASRGILCVNSQGNSPCIEAGTFGTPSDADSMIAVGAVDSLNEIASFSACGPSYDGRIKPEVVARGVDTWWAFAGSTSTYGDASGTSLSAPLVSGAAALLIEAHPEWGPMDVRDALIETADKTDDPDSLYGHGRIDTEAALNTAPVIFPTPFSLVTPEDGEVVPTLRPTLIWQTSQDPDEQDMVFYTVWLEDLDNPDNPFSFYAHTDTFVTVPFPLRAMGSYVWEVSAEDIHGNRRYSREGAQFIAGSLADVPGSDDPPVVADSGLDTRLLIRCTPNPFRDVMRFRVGESAAGARPDTGVNLHWAIYDPLGRRVHDGVSAAEADGSYRAHWGGTYASGQSVSPGIYYMEARVGSRFVRETIVRLAK